MINFIKGLLMSKFSDNNRKYVVLHTEKSPSITNTTAIKKSCKKIIQRIKNCTKLKHFGLLLIFPAVFLLISGFIHKLPEQNYGGELKSGASQLFPLKNETGKKDGFPSTGTINLNNRINDVYKDTAPLKQAAIQNRQYTLEKPLITASYNDVANNQKQSPSFLDNNLKEITRELKPHLTKDKYSSNTYASYSKRKKAIAPYVNHYADKFGLDRELVMSIIQVESNFIPHALSEQNAHGLMQIVPDMAAAEVNRIFKHDKEISSIDLMHPESNIYYGTAYLYLLKRYHLNGIQNHDSLNSVLIASYNAGSSAVLRHFGKTKEEAINKINSMSPEEVYKSLTQTYRSGETREYLKRVTENLG